MSIYCLIIILVEFNSFTKVYYVSFSHSVPPLTQGNVLEALKGVQDWEFLKKWCGIYSASSNEDVVKQFLLGRDRYQSPSWRVLTFILDLMNETQIANRIRNHGEPVQGVCVCVCVCVCVRAAFKGVGWGKF